MVSNFTFICTDVVKENVAAAPFAEFPPNHTCQIPRRVYHYKSLSNKGQDSGAIRAILIVGPVTHSTTFDLFLDAR